MVENSDQTLQRVEEDELMNTEPANSHLEAAGLHLASAIMKSDGNFTGHQLSSSPEQPYNA